LTFFPDDGEMKFFLAGGCLARARTTGRGGSKPRRDDGKDRRGDARVGFLVMWCARVM
jgi:hypothetical protein